MNCREAGNALSPYLDGELDDRRRAQLEQHLAGCARCAAEVALQRHAFQLLAAPKTMAQPEGLLAEFKQRLAAEAPAPRRTWRSAPWSWSLAGLAATAAAAALVISLHGGRSTALTPDALRQIAQQPSDLRLLPEAPAVHGRGVLRASPPGGPTPGDDYRREAPATATAPTKAEPPATSPAPDSLPASRELTREMDSATGNARTAGKKLQERLPEPAMTPFGPRVRTNHPLLADKRQLPELTLPAAERKKTASLLREQDALGAAPPAPAGTTSSSPASERASRAAPADGGSSRRDDGTLAKIASAASARDMEAPTTPPPAEARLEVTVHRPYPDTGDRTPAAAGSFGAGATVGARGGFGGGGAPGATPAGPPSAAAASTGLVSVTPEIAPEVIAALRAPVDLRVANETLLGLTDRLSAAASVPIVVEDTIVQQLRVTAKLNGVPLYRALETVATQANLVIAPRPGGITLQLRASATPAQGESEKLAAAQTVWSPAWGTLPRTGFAVNLARSPGTIARNRQAAGAHAAKGSNARGNAGAVNNNGNKDTAAAQRRKPAADQALALQNQQTLQRAAGQLGALNATPTLLECPHCHRPLSSSAAYLCPKCKHAVKATDLKCANCGQPTPAHCPHCHKPLAVQPKSSGGR
jgi:Putative zinc-finger